MTSYESRIDQFAKGKTFVRLSKPVRDRADFACDACQSTRPRNLYALQDEGSRRYYFVGETCLKELVRRKLVVRRFSRELGKSAFEQEMATRAKEHVEKVAADEVGVRVAATIGGRGSGALAPIEPRVTPLLPTISLQVHLS